MAWRVRWTDSAWDSVERQAAYIELDSPRYAAAIVREARDAARSLRQFPNRGRVVPEKNDSAIRELFVFHSYRMLYQVLVQQHEVRIIAFVHGARELLKALDEN
ncbi:MAG: type II toxin-antitoxin system RelE/ParE family toxin [Thermoanaerobaculia bacterium]